MTSPPSSTQLEESLLGELLNHGDVDAARAYLGDSGDAFADPFHGRLYSAAVALHRTGRIVDGMTVAAELNGSLQPAALARLLDLVTAGGLSRDAGPHAAEVARLARHRRVLAALDLARERIARDPDRTAEALAALAIVHTPVEDVDAAVTGWARIDLVEALSGNGTREMPTLMPRVDGRCLLYPGRVNDFHGESESAKSFIAQYVCAGQVRAGVDVLYLDYETDENLVVPRLLLFGCEPDDVLAHFDYRRPGTAGAPGDPAHAEIFTRSYALAVIDGVTDSIGLSEGRISDNDEVARWRRALPDRLARDTRAAVLMIDHVTKDKETRGRYAIGAQAKLAGISGASYSVEVLAEVAPGLRGEVALRVAKDRPGAVRAVSGKPRMSDRTQEAARVVLDSTIPGVITVTVNCSEETLPGAQARVWHPTNLMAKVSAFLTLYPGSSARECVLAVKGNSDAKRQAVAQLVTAGYVATEKAGRGGGFKHRNITPFIEGMDPEMAVDTPQEPLS